MESKRLAEGEYLQINRDLWDSRVEPHLQSEFYAVKEFKEGGSSLKEIELSLLPELKGQKVLHLQCHFGQDSLSLARLGARVTGLDFSGKAIETARMLAATLDLDAEFIQGDVYDASALISEPYDFVFTTYGVLGWLPDLARWAETVAKCLKPSGELLLVEFHPFVWTFDNDFTRPTYSYFQREPIVEYEEGSYADKSASVLTKSVGWNHSLGEVFSALTRAGMRIIHFGEYDFSPYPIFNNNSELGKGRWGIKGMEGLLPLVFSR